MTQTVFSDDSQSLRTFSYKIDTVNQEELENGITKEGMREREKERDHHSRSILSDPYIGSKTDQSK